MRIGVDVGGSHIGLGLVNKDGKLVLKAEKDYDKIQEDMSNIVLETIIELINKIIDNNDVKKEEKFVFPVYFDDKDFDDLEKPKEKKIEKKKEKC